MLEVAVPPGVVILMGPETVPGTLAVIWAELSRLNEALIPLKVTEEADEKLVPVTTTKNPRRPEGGLIFVMVGGGTNTVNELEEVAVPRGVMITIAPLAAPTGTVTVIWVALFSMKDGAEVPLKVTAVAPLRFVPVIITVDPTNPEVGLKPVMAGDGGNTVKFTTLVAVPPAVVTVRAPLVAPTGTAVTIWLAVLDVIVAAVPLNFTEAPLRFDPLMVTASPGPAEPGVNPLITGAGVGCGWLPPPPPLQDSNKPRPRAAQPLKMEPNQVLGRMRAS